MPLDAPQTCAPTLMTLGGQVSVQTSLPTVTVKVQLVKLPLASVTEQFTVVVPCGKLAPDAGLQVDVPTPGQLSATVGDG